MKILFILNELSQVCGTSKHFSYLLSGLIKYQQENEYFIIAGGGNAIDNYRKFSVPLVIDNAFNHQSRSVYGYLKGILILYKFVIKYKIDIVHSHHFYASNIASVVSKFSSIKTVLTNHGIIPEIGKLNHFRADHIIAVNKHIVDYVIKNKIKSDDNVSLIPSGFPILETMPIKKKGLIVISGGRLTKQKGFDIYIEAIARLPNNVKEATKFLLAGCGEEEIKLKELNNNLNATVDFLGPINDFQQYLLSTHIFVMPTQSTTEGFPMALVEAALAKNLILSSKFRGYNFVLSNENSILFEAGNVEELSDHLLRVLTNFQQYSEKITSLQKLVSKLFNFEDMVYSTNLVYRKLIN